jgi:adenine/guanine phosphoribosyltransferase-like PRPP-binding protein
MAKKNQHVVPVGSGKWGVRGEGNGKITKITTTQSDAIVIARDIAKNQGSELVIHRQNGQIRDKDSYGNDPCPPEDKKH